ncbi:MAG: phosphate starvation-inducible protein PsiF [Rhizobacter sp.]|nr:phosphate starvation-inducible protein PsiF [Rhizobacter sp.]
MKTLLSAIALAVAGFAGSAHAADAASAPTKQQNKMVSCNKEAGDKKGDERKAFMSDCLKKEKDAKTAQQNKMKTCSADFKATKKPGSERQAFMKECLSK